MTEFMIIGNFTFLNGDVIAVDVNGSLITVKVTEKMAKDLMYICPKTSVKIKGVIMDKNELVAKSCHILAGER